MSLYSDKLTDLIRRHGDNVYALAKASGVNRTLIHKLMSGTRKPGREDKLERRTERLAEAMMLTPVETNELLRARDIMVMGEGVYKRRKLVHRFLTDFKKLDQNTKISDGFTVQVEETCDLPACIEGTAAVARAMRTLLGRALHGKSGQTVVAHLKADYTFFTEYLVAEGGAESHCKIQHVLPLESHDIWEENAYNLQCIRDILPAIIGCRDYRPYSYYIGSDHAIAQFGALPYFVVTDDGVLALSYDLSGGTFSEDEAVKKLYRGLFEQIHRSAQPVVNVLDTPVKHMQHYQQLSAEAGGTMVSFGIQPSFPMGLTVELCRKYGRQEILDALDAEDDLLTRHIQHCAGQYMKAKTICTFHSMAGIDDFLENGRLAEYPSAYYEPFSKADRILIVENFLVAARQKIATVQALRGFEDFSPNLTTGMMSPKFASVVYNHPKKGFLAFCIIEKSISYAIYDYILSLRDSEDIYTEEETIAKIQEKLDRYRAENEIGV